METRASFRKTLEALCRSFPGAMAGDVLQPDLADWLSKGPKGVLSAKTFNNRLGFVRTFFSRCRDWNYLPPGEHAAERINKRKEPDRIPEILTPAEATAALKALPPYLIPTFVVGCWMGPRPQSELRMIEWENFDWHRGYLHVTTKAARKTMRERFVPIPENVRTLLAPWRHAKGKISGRMHIQEISKKLRDAKVVKNWPQDGMRHSYISYQIALGHGIGQVAEWAGNSEAKIRKNYRRPMRKIDGEEWFAVGLEKP